MTGAEVGGALSGECRYARAEERTESDGWSIGAPTEPLRLTCDFVRDGRAIGWLRLGAVAQAPALFQPEARVGEVEVNGTRLSLRSAHRMGERGMRVEDPIGYLLEAGDGVAVGAVDTNGFTRARLRCRATLPSATRRWSPGWRSPASGTPEIPMIERRRGGHRSARLSRNVLVDHVDLAHAAAAAGGVDQRAQFLAAGAGAGDVRA